VPVRSTVRTASGRVQLVSHTISLWLFAKRAWDGGLDDASAARAAVDRLWFQTALRVTMQTTWRHAFQVRMACVAVWLACTVTPGSAASQDAPRVVGAQVLGAFDAWEWPVVAARTDSTWATTFQRQSISLIGTLLLSRLESGGVVQGEIRVDSAPTGALMSQVGKQVVRGLSPTLTVAELAAMSPRAFLLLVLNASVPSPGGIGYARLTRRTLLGIVPDGDSLAHAVYRVMQPYATSWAVQILTLRRSTTGWYAVLNADLIPITAVARLVDDPAALPAGAPR
jgi:hypothetical protein